MKYCRHCLKIYEDKWYHMCPENAGYSSEFVDLEDSELNDLVTERDNLIDDYADMEDERDYWRNKYESLLT